MSVEVLLDTNVLAYADDRSETLKQQQALQIFDALLAAGSGVVSAQTLSEFFVTVTRKLAEPLPLPEAQETVHRFVRIWKVAGITSSVILEAVRGAVQHRLWAVARLNRIPILLSEDFSDGTALEGVRFVNPFRPAFRISDLL